MASSSSSSARSSQLSQWKYDVFLSFRGADTSRNFTSHLYKGLTNRGVITFLDDERLVDGGSIQEELEKVIEESQVALIVFSKNYATSRWCLSELVKIMECKEKYGQLVIPIFYDVDPSDVRKQRESFAEAFAKHELMYKDDFEGMKKVKGWRTALAQAADISGYDIRDRGTMAVEAIWLTCFEQLCFDKKAMENMKRLRILCLCHGNEYDGLTSFSSPPSSIDSGEVPYGSIEYLPNNLRWFIWNHFPWVSLPKNFEPQRLVLLDLWWSLLCYLWHKAFAISTDAGS